MTKAHEKWKRHQQEMKAAGRTFGEVGRTSRVEVFVEFQVRGENGEYMLIPKRGSKRNWSFSVVSADCIGSLLNYPVPHEAPVQKAAEDWGGVLCIVWFL